MAGHITTPMTKVVLDKDPNLLKHWSSLNPMGRIGMIHELRGVMVWLLSDASTFCTGSESVNWIIPAEATDYAAAVSSSLEDTPPGERPVEGLPAHSVHT